MKAAVFYDVEDIRLEDVPEPEIGDGDVLIEVTACGICGSDLEYYMGRSPVGTADGKGPLILGHEFAGKVAKLGKYVRTRAEHAHKLPDSMSDEQGAFVEMLAASLNAIEKAEIRLGDLVVIYGPGPVGLSMVQLAKASGGRVVIVGTRDYRLELAKGMGAAHAFNVSDASSPYYTADLPASIQGVNGGELADKAIVATASEEATQGALDVTGNGSTIVYMGLAGPNDIVKLPMLSSLAMDKTIRFSWLYPNQWPNTIRLLREGVVDTSKIITHSIALDEIDAGIRQVVARDDGVIKIIVKP